MDEKEDAGKDASPWWKSIFQINKKLLPLKITLFMFSGAGYAVIPYLTIHMKDIGISDLDVALIYSIIPFCIFLAPPLVGFVADKLGNYTRVIMIFMILTGLFHTALLFVPPTITHVSRPNTAVTIRGSEFTLAWEKCEEDIITEEPTCATKEVRKRKVFMKLEDCSLTCGGNLNTSQAAAASALCSLSPGVCKVNPVTGSVTLRDLTAAEVTDTCRNSSLALAMSADLCSAAEDATDSASLRVSVPPGCSASCASVTTNLVPTCGTPVVEGRVLTNVVYFLLRMLATMALACVFIILDAQTIQMCKLEAAAGNKGSYGRQIVYKTLANAMVAPLVGVIMDKITAATGAVNYVAPFVICDVLLLCALVSLCFVDRDIGLPKTDTKKGVKLILTNVNIMVFLFMVLMCGVMFGFVETFLFVYLKEDLNAPIYLLGLTITTGALVSIPFLYMSDYIVGKVGMVNMFILGLAMYGVRYLGYSYLTCPWFAFPYEALEVFTLFLLRVAMAEYIKENAPPGTLATLNGMAGGAHFGFGKGVGGLLGGILKDQLGSMAVAFRVFSVISFVCSLLYALYHYTIGRRLAATNTNNKEENAVPVNNEMKPFLLKKDAE